MTEDSGGKPPKEGGGSAAREGSTKPSSSGAAGSAGPALSPGARLGRYEIVELLGTGGMGEVYVARDIRLGRRVALKVLPSFYAENPDRLRRFEREARAASLLNHPNIVAIFDVGSFRNQPYLVTELLEGRTLRAELDSGPFPMERVLRYGIQVARALAAAHERGVIHRDLKPANVFVSGDGSLKLLDFGLAKLVHADREIADSEDDTVSAPTATLGAIGSSGYMSPEQVQGRPVDNRSDIFSFGILLYEMISGSSPFRRPSTVETLHAIVKDPPAPLEAATPSVPASMAAIVRRCLAKRPEDRFHSARDLLFSLQGALADIADLYEDRGKHTFSKRAWKTRLFGPHVAFAIIVAVLIAALVVGGGRMSHLLESEVETSVLAGAELRIIPITESGNVRNNGSLSPDGDFFAYVAELPRGRSLRLRHLPTKAEAELIPPEPVVRHTHGFSPDGSLVYYSEMGSPGEDAVTELYVIPFLGGTPRRVLQSQHYWDGFQARLSPSGAYFAFITHPNPSVMVATLQEDKVEELVSFGDGTSIAGLAWSSDETLLAITVRHGSSTEVVVVDRGDGNLRSLFGPEGSSGLLTDLSWLPDGSGILAVDESSQQYRHLSFPEGSSEQLSVPSPFPREPEVRPDGSVLAFPRQTQLNLWTVSLEEGAPVASVTGGLNAEDGLYGMAWTPDDRIVFAALDREGHLGLWMIDEDGRHRRRLDDGTGLGAWAAGLDVSEDGKLLAFLKQDAQPDIWITPLASWAPRRVTSIGSAAAAPVFTPDGRSILFSSSGDNHVRQVSVEGGEQRIVAEDCLLNDISRDGRWVVCCTRHDVERVVSLDDGSIRWEGDLEANYPVRWAPDGEALIYADDPWAGLRGGVSSVWLQRLDGGAPRRLTEFPPTSHFVLNLDVRSDGKKLLLARGRVIRDAVLLEGLLPRLRGRRSSS